MMIKPMKRPKEKFSFASRPKSDSDRAAEAKRKINQLRAGERVVELMKRVDKLEKIVSESKRKFDILIKYTDGDSDRTYDAEKLLGGNWESLVIAEENLNRIKEHHDWITKGGKENLAPEFMKELNGGTNAIPLKLDDGSVWQIYVFWKSWSAYIHSAKIIEILPEYPEINNFSCF